MKISIWRWDKIVYTRCRVKRKKRYVIGVLTIKDEETSTYIRNDINGEYKYIKRQGEILALLYV